jgi:putative transposase
MVRQEKTPKHRFSSGQIVEILKAHEKGATVAKLCRQHDISPTTFYKWRAKFASHAQGEPPEQKQTAMLEDENRRLKQLLAEVMLENSIFRERLAKKRL